VNADPLRRWVWSIGLAAAAILGLAGCASVTVTTTSTTVVESAAAAPAPSTVSGGGPDLLSLGFSTNGDKCDSGDSVETFAVGVPIHVVLEMSPALPTGGTVTVTTEKDGVEILEARQTITVTEPAPCIYGTLHDLEAGHYRVTYAVSPSAMPPFSGEFDVTS
jgi:hypothetical protein